MTVCDKDRIMPFFFWSNKKGKNNSSFRLLTLVNSIQNYYSWDSSSELWHSVAYGNVMFEVASFGC